MVGVCVRERQRQRQRDREREGGRDRETERPRQEGARAQVKAAGERTGDRSVTVRGAFRDKPRGCLAAGRRKERVYCRLPGVFYPQRASPGGREVRRRGKGGESKGNPAEPPSE